MKIENKIIRDIEDKVSFTPNYEDIKEKIKLDSLKEQKSKSIIRFNIKYALVCTLVLVVIFIGIVASNKESNVNTYVPMLDRIISVNDAALIENYEYVFVAKVNKMEKDLEHDEKVNGSGLATALYDIKVVSYIKSNEKVESTTLAYYGLTGDAIVSEEKHDYLEEGKYYLFFANYKDEGSKSESLIPDKSFVVAYTNQKILLTDYNEELEYNQQVGVTNQIISRYENVINKNLGNEKLEIKDYQNIEELVADKEFVYIIQVGNCLGVDTLQAGENSDIVSMKYRVDVVHKLKGQDERFSIILYAYGTNIWDEQKEYEHFVSILEVGSVYLMVADKKDINDPNERISEDDYVVYDNCQVIKLDGYVLGTSYTKQMELIKKIVEEYEFD